MVSEDFLNEYVEEVKEHLQELESSLLALEREGTSKDTINEIFRAAHSIKGASAYMGFEQLANLTHDMESLMSEVRSQSRDVPPEGISVLLECVDFIANALRHLQEGGEEPPLPETLLEKLRHVFSIRQEPLPPEAPLRVETVVDETPAEPVSVPESSYEFDLDTLFDEESPALSGEELAASGSTEQIVEEDQELLGIFLDACQQNLSELAALFAASGGTGLTELAFEQARAAIRRIIHSSQYMDYEQVVTLLEAFDQDLVDAYTGNKADRQTSSRLLAACAQKLQHLFPALQLPFAPPAEPAESDAASSEAIDEEDEELLKIFLDSIQEQLVELAHLTPLFPEMALSEVECDRAHELITRLISSSQYMDYDPVVNLLSEWDQALGDAFENGTADGHRYTELLNSTLERLKKLLPRLAVPTPALPPEAASEAAQTIDEEDEELLKIFLDSMQEQLGELTDLTPILPEMALSDVEFDRARELLTRLIASSQYMDYDPVVNLLSEWDQALGDAFENGTADGHRYTELLNSTLERLKKLLPRLAVPSSGEAAVEVEESIQEEDQELFTIFMDSFQEHFSELANLIPPSPDVRLSEIEFERAQELFGRLSSSSQYMDYGPVVTVLSEWEQSFADVYQSGMANGSLLSDNLYAYGQRLRKLLPRLEIPMPSSSREPVSTYPGLDQQIDTSFDTLEALLRPDSEALIPDRFPEFPGGLDLSRPEGESAAPEPAASPTARKAAKKRRGAAEEAPATTTLRVDAQKVDQLLNQVGELVVTRSEFIQTTTLFRDMLRDFAAQGRLSKDELRKLRWLNFRLNESTMSLGRVATDLQDSVMRIRMLPISQLFQRFPRVVRDQALKVDKKVDLIVEGGDTEIDKRVLEQMHDPLVQFLRNAIAHGIESPAARLAAGKPEVGTIRLAAYQEGDTVAMEIEDDGRGIDTRKLRRILASRKDIGAAEVERLTDQEVMYAIFLPGISTHDRVDGTAGRGVGLDVVKENVERMNGTIEVSSYPGVGTRFTIRIPLTVAIIRALLVQGSSHVFTVPLTAVAEILRYEPEATHTIEGFQVITLRGKTIPLVSLDELLNMTEDSSRNGHRFIVIVATSFREVGLVVDGLMGEREVVIKSLEDDFHAFEGFSGATILGDGSISLILDVSALLKRMKDVLGGKDSLIHDSYVH